MRIVIFDWFASTHCPMCDKADKRGEAIFALLRDLTWTDAEQAELRYKASFMVDKED